MFSLLISAPFFAFVVQFFLRDAVYIWPNRGIIITTVLLSLPPNFGTLLPFSYQITDMSSVFEGEKLDSLQVAPTKCLSICLIVVEV